MFVALNPIEAEYYNSMINASLDGYEALKRLTRLIGMANIDIEVIGFEDIPEQPEEVVAEIPEEPHEETKTESISQN